MAKRRHDALFGRQRRPLATDSSWAYQFGESGRWDYFLHAHDCYELICIDRGHCKYTIGNFSASAAGATIFLLAPRLPHSFFTEGFLPNSERIVSHMFWFEPRMIEAWRGQLPEFDDLAPLLSRARHGVQFERGLSRRVIDGFRDVETLSGIHGCTRIVDLLGQLAAGTSWQLSPEAADGDLESEALARLGAIDDWMHVHYRQDVSLPEAAEAMGVSVSTLNQLLKKYLRCTFLHHLTRIRVDQAKHELEHSRDSITAIAFDCGFNSIPTFNRRFKQMVGVSPQEYRKRFRFS